MTAASDAAVEAGMTPDDPDRRARSAAVLAVAVAFTATPLRAIWARADAPWWTPFAVWGAICLAGAWLARREVQRSDGVDG